MKNFFKKLALVLALAMVVLAIAPAANASAAAAPKLNTTGKKLYLEQDVATGNYKDYFTLKVWNKGDYKVTFKSMNPEIATIHSTKGTVKAKAVGEALLKATVTNTKTGKVVKNLECKVWVKRNAVEIGVSSASAAKLDNVLAIGDKVKLNIFRKAVTGQVAWQQADKTIVTDYIVWTSSNTKVATVDKWGTVKAVGEGTATITAKSLQTEAKTVPTTKEVKLTVTVGQKGLVSATQLTDTKVELTFGVPVTKEDVNTSTLTLMNNKGVNMSNHIKSVKLNEEGTVATVETHIPFVDGVVYTFAVPKMETSVDFKASLGDVAKVVITGPTKVQTNNTSDITVKFYDANNVEVAGDVNKIEFSLVDSNANAWVSGKTITIFSDNQNVAIKGIYNTGKFDSNYNEIKIEVAPFVVTSAADLSASIKNIDTIVTSNTNPSKEDFVAGNMTLPAETNKSYFLKVRATLTDDTTYTGKVTFESTDSSKLIVDPITGALIPLATGSVGVIVKIGDVTVVKTVVIGAKEVPASLEVSNNNLVLSNGSVDNTATVTVKVLSNYNNVLSTSLDKVQVVNASSNTDLACNKGIDTKGNATFTFDATGIKAGTYAFKVTVEEKTFIINVKVLDATADNAVSYNKFVIGSTIIDTAIDKDSTINGLNFNVEALGYANNGAALNKAGKFANVTIRNPKGEIIFSNETGKVVNNAAVMYDQESGLITIMPIYGSNLASSDNYKKMEVGTYQISGFVYYDTVNKTYTTEAPTSSNGIVTKVIAPVTFTVKDSQAKPSVSFKTSALVTENRTLAGIKSLIKDQVVVSNKENATFTVKDIELTSTYDDGKTGTYAFVVKKVIVEETVNSNAIAHEITVNQVINVVVK